MEECKLCNCRNIEEIHRGTRDNNGINVLKCQNCGLVFLSSFIHLGNNFYEESHMHDNEEENSFEEWSNLTEQEDIERADRLRNLCKGKVIVDFGCGNGGFLKHIQPDAAKVIGIEIEESARRKLNQKGILVYKNLTEYQGKADIITCFHVLEHLAEPEIYLNEMKEYLTEQGIIVLETPNAEDALLSFYDSKDFADFTYWSPHIILYSFNTMQILADKVDLEVKWNRQVQRYPLANHLYWLAKGLPGGHDKWQLFNAEILNKEYKKILEENHMCDTLYVCLQKRNP